MSLWVDFAQSITFQLTSIIPPLCVTHNSKFFLISPNYSLASIFDLLVRRKVFNLSGKRFLRDCITLWTSIGYFEMSNLISKIFGEDTHVGE